ncbi:hypothetical protein HK102_003713 [Quaeritorhiza haematococci]|nr:hypothetical protein HK102_003713 [Quaeritorhiza haematococci]
MAYYGAHLVGLLIGTVGLVMSVSKLLTALKTHWELWAGLPRVFVWRLVIATSIILGASIPQFTWRFIIIFLQYPGSSSSTSSTSNVNFMGAGASFDDPSVIELARQRAAEDIIRVTLLEWQQTFKMIILFMWFAIGSKTCENLPMWIKRTLEWFGIVIGEYVDIGRRGVPWETGQRRKGNELASYSQKPDL